jgi:hypothetical protein
MYHEQPFEWHSVSCLTRLAALREPRLALLLNQKALEWTSPGHMATGVAPMPRGPNGEMAKGLGAIRWSKAAARLCVTALH